MKSKAIVALCAIIFIFTIVIPAVRYIMKATSKKGSQFSKKLKLEEELEEVKRGASMRSLGVETFDPTSEYDKSFMLNRKAYENARKIAKKSMDMNLKYSRAVAGKANQLFILAEKFMTAGNYERAADSLLAALKAEPNNQIMKLKIYQKLAMIATIGNNEKTMLKALLRYIETCEGLDNDPETKTELKKVKLEFESKIASNN